MQHTTYLFVKNLSEVLFSCHSAREVILSFMCASLVCWDGCYINIIFITWMKSTINVSKINISISSSPCWDIYNHILQCNPRHLAEGLVTLSIFTPPLILSFTLFEALATNEFKSVSSFCRTKFTFVKLWPAASWDSLISSQCEREWKWAVPQVVLLLV